MQRITTVTRTIDKRSIVPMIRLRGQWLERIGFHEGCTVRVEVSARQLVLTVAENGKEIAVPVLSGLGGR